VNDEPIVVNETITVNKDTPINGNIVLNDSDTETTLKVITIPIVNPNNGVFIVDTSGNYTYNPNLNYTGLDTVIVSVCDKGTPLPVICLNDTVFITIEKCNVSNANLDCDGDGVTNGKEDTDGTDPNDLCDFIVTNQTVETSVEWKALDCDGDGTKNANDTIPLDPCIGGTLGNENISNAIYLTADCDGDGVTNVKEKEDGTDPNDNCSIVKSSQTVEPSAVWKGQDCDGDGRNNDYDTDPTNPCEDGIAGNADETNPIWKAADCDGDGVTNADEAIDGTSTTDPCDYNVSSITVATDTTWNELDCDGDGVPNGVEVIEGTNPKDVCDLNESSISLDITEFCPFELPEGFSPNGDGVNDVYFIKDVELYPNNTFKIFNRWGNVVFDAHPYENDWSGEVSAKVLSGRGANLPAGVYFYVFDYGDGSEVIKGYIYLNK
jgi:gliding motility-associated-like protein